MRIDRSYERNCAANRFRRRLRRLEVGGERACRVEMDGDVGFPKKRTAGIRRNADRSFPLERAESALLLSELSLYR